MFDPRKYPPDVAAGDGLDYRAVQSRRAEAVEGIEIGGRERIIRFKQQARLRQRDG